MSTSGATGVTAARQVVEALAEHEDAIGDLYEAYGVCFADAASFWRGLSAEEYGHGSLMRDLTVHEHELDVFVDTQALPAARAAPGDARRARPDRGRRGQPAHARRGAADCPRLRTGDRRARGLPGLYERLAQRGPRAQPSARLVGAAPRRHQGAPDAPAAVGGQRPVPICDNCGMGLPVGYEYCFKCGYPVRGLPPEDAAAAGAAAQQPPPPRRRRPRRPARPLRLAPFGYPAAAPVRRARRDRPHPGAGRLERPVLPRRSSTTCWSRWGSRRASSSLPGAFGGHAGPAQPPEQHVEPEMELVGAVLASFFAYNVICEAVWPPRSASASWACGSWPTAAAPPACRALVLRNLTKVASCFVWPVGVPLALFTMATNPNHQRLGDRLAAHLRAARRRHVRGAGRSPVGPPGVALRRRPARIAAPAAVPGGLARSATRRRPPPDATPRRSPTPETSAASLSTSRRGCSTGIAGCSTRRARPTARSAPTPWLVTACSRGRVGTRQRRSL